MSLKRVKNVFDNMSNAQDVLLQILQINTSKTGNISYIVRPIIFEPVDRMKQFLLEIREKYIDDKKGFDASFSSCIDYDGTADGKTIYHLSTDNVLIKTEYNALTNALASPETEEDPLLMKANASVITFTIEENGERIPVKLFSMQNPVTVLKHKFLRNNGKFEEYTGKILNLKTSVDVLIIGKDVYFLTMAGENLFNMERAYKKLCSDYVVSIGDSGIVVNAEAFSAIASSGHNPRRFVSYNESRLEKLKNGQTRKRIARIFFFILTDGKLDATDPKDADRIVKILCDKGMTDPFEDEAMEVSSARKWI